MGELDSPIIQERIIKPQQGKQEDFLSSPADIVIYGGQAGGGKTWGLLLEPLRHMHVEGFTGAIFRRETPQIRAPGALWDQATELYSYAGTRMNKSTLEVIFTEKSHIKFSHLEMEDDIHSWDGSEICYLAFDQLEGFTEKQFFYMLTRNRSVCGVSPYVRATCNPVPEDDKIGGWLNRFVAWWINQDTGYAIDERSGVVRYFIRQNLEVIWDDDPKRLKELYPGSDPLSMAFIPASVYDNPILLLKDPKYLANLKAQDMVTRERLLKGNWKIKPTAGMIFKREWFEIVKSVPKEKIIRTVRFWDRACTVESQKNKDPDYTAGLLMSVSEDGVYYIRHISRFRARSMEQQRSIKNMAKLDTPITDIGLEQEPGASGKTEVNALIRMLSGFNARAYSARGDKVTRAMPVSAQAEAGNIKVMDSSWKHVFFDELENFDGNPKKHDDQVDALSGAFEMLQEDFVAFEETYAVNGDYING